MNRCTNKSSIPGDAAHLMRADTLRIAGVVKESIVDGPGIRFTVFCQGCPHACPGCHNTQTHDFDGGFECKIDKIVAAIDDNPLIPASLSVEENRHASQQASMNSLSR